MLIRFSCRMKTIKKNCFHFWVWTWAFWFSSWQAFAQLKPGKFSARGIQVIYLLWGTISPYNPSCYTYVIPDVDQYTYTVQLISKWEIRNGGQTVAFKGIYCAARHLSLNGLSYSHRMWFPSFFSTMTAIHFLMVSHDPNRFSLIASTMCVAERIKSQAWPFRLSSDNCIVGNNIYSFRWL